VIRQRITNQICKESPSAKQFPGKLDFHNAPFLDSKSRTWEFFTDDALWLRGLDQMLAEKRNYIGVELRVEANAIKAWRVAT
jgi:hypothetical protein